MFVTIFGQRNVRISQVEPGRCRSRFRIRRPRQTSCASGTGKTAAATSQFEGIPHEKIADIPTKRFFEIAFYLKLAVARNPGGRLTRVACSNSKSFWISFVLLQWAAKHQKLPSIPTRRSAELIAYRQPDGDPAL